MFDRQTAVLILNYNGHDFLKKFLPSVVANSKNADIVVIDNASTDNSLKLLREEFLEEIELIVLDKNKGFAAGYNDGINKLERKYEYYALLNSDIEINSDWLPPLVTFLDNNKNAACCQPKILSYSKKECFEYAGAAGGFLDRYYYPFCRGRVFSTIEIDQSQYNHPVEVHWTSGAAMLIRAEIFKQQMGFDEDFFAHMEEIDLCLRIRAQGKSLFCIPESTVFHVGGGTLNYNSPKKTYLNYRNNLSLIIKNHDGWLPSMLFTRMLLDGISACLFLSKFKFRHFFQIGFAHGYMYLNFYRNWQKRKALRAKRTKSNELYRGSIVFDYFIRKIKHFHQLNSRRFIL